MSTAAIVLAGGSGSRVQREVNKVYLPIAGRDLLEYSLEALEHVPQVTRIVLVVRDEDRPRADALLSDLALSTPIEVVSGGPSRHRSELAGLEALAGLIDQDAVDLVAIHDGARPFVTVELVERLVGAAARRGGAIPGLAVEEPLYRVAGGEAEPLAPETLRKAQTPQVFRARPLLDAYRRSTDAGFEGVDTAETVERFSDLEVAVVPGDPRNIKVTFVEDFFTAEEWATGWKQGRWVKG